MTEVPRWQEHPYRLTVSAGAVFYLILVERYDDALKICRTYLSQRPDSSVMSSLELACLYHVGRRAEIWSRGERLLLKKGDSESLGPFILGLLAAAEGNFEVSSRFLREAAARGNFEAAELERHIPWS